MVALSINRTENQRFHTKEKVMNRFILSRRHQTGKRRAASARPVLELLEDRTVLSTLTVLNALDSGAGSLRATIKAASSGDTILFDSSLSGQTITLTSGELAITKSLDIEGLGSSQLAISGNNASRVFNVSQNQKPVTVTIAGLTIENGLDSASGHGGAVVNVSSTLNLMSDVLSNNHVLNSSGASGGAVFNHNGGTLVVTSCKFSDNQAIGTKGASAGGGAIENYRATATITGSTFTTNLAQAGDGANGISSFGQGRGGAIRNFGQMTVKDCTIDGNQAKGGNNAAPSTNPAVPVALGIGGGIENYSGTLTVSNTFITNNHATGGTTTSGHAGPGAGGGLDVFVSASMIMDNNCTVSGNTATGGSGGGGANGGGLFLAFSSTATVTNSTFSDNQAIAGTGKVGVAGGNAVGGGITVGLPASIAPGDNSSLSLSNCAITGNLAQAGDGGAGLNGGDARGGGVAVDSGSSSATLTTCTITSNSAFGGAAGSGGNAGQGLGGGLYIEAGAIVCLDSFTETNITGNHASNHQYDNIFGSYTIC
jgi:hypothetical protein